MTDSEYLDLAERTLKSVEASCDRLNACTDADIDNQRSGGMVTLSFANRSQIVINLQRPLHELWLAAKSGGFHFKCDTGRWLDSKNQSEFYAVLSSCASEQAGLALTFVA